TYLQSITRNGFSWQAQAAPPAYLKKSFPPLQFTYSPPAIDPQLHFAGPESLENLPEGADGSRYEWVDLDSEGSPGILSRQADGWYYKRNLSPLPIQQPDGTFAAMARFAPSETVLTQPVPSMSGTRQQIMDLAGDGRKSLVEFGKPAPGYYERREDGQWDSFIPFASNPNVAWNDPNLKMIDLNGDGFPDILITEDDVLRWYPSRAKEGFGPSATVRKPFYEDRGPALVFADPTQSMFLADMTGDGLTDIVRIRCGEVCYWPNMGYGNFGAKVSMDGAPYFGTPDSFDPRRIRLADIDGSGTTDLLYLGDDSIRFWFNLSGNGFGGVQSLPQWAPTDRLSSVTALDLMGNGTSCLVWSSPLPADQDRPLRYIDLTGSQKPHLLTSIDNQMGKKTAVTYAPSTKFYLKDKYAETPWVTRLPFPVQVVERVDSYDLINQNRFVARYAYHHGYYDGVEREFRGFGMVEQWDTEEFGALNANGALPQGNNFDAASNVPPVRVKTWFHTGAYFGRARIARYFEGEYYQGDSQAWSLPDSFLDPGVAARPLTAHEEREACRALKGLVLRRETYADDGSGKSQDPYGVEEHAYNVTMLQPVLGGGHPGLEPPHGVFYPYEREVLTYHYERNPADPRIGHQMTLAVDDYGNVLQTAAIAYPRRQVPALPAGLSTPANLSEQSQILATYKVSTFFNNDLSWNDTDFYRAGVPLETQDYEVIGLALPASGGPFPWSGFVGQLQGATVISYEITPASGVLQNRLIGDSRTLYWADDLSGPLGFASAQPVESHALVFQTYKMALTYGLVQNIYQSTAYPTLNAEALAALVAPAGGYVPDSCVANGSAPTGAPFTSGNLWVPSGQAVFDPSQFYLPVKYIDPFGNTTTVTYDTHALLLL
ncbi:MAG TPA: toxin TcdB middle/N-terminal domain-containing protein, partial [bacterium]|nr:toxin TcdB middle/N-terminal domain-containing protein [bacterium]